MQETVTSLLCQDKMTSISNHVRGVTHPAATKVTQVRAVPPAQLLIQAHPQDLHITPARVL